MASSYADVFSVPLIPFQRLRECCVGRSKPTVEKVACQFCRRRFKTEKDLQSHLRSKHAQELLATSAPGNGSRLQVVVEDDWMAVVVKPQGIATFGTGSFAKSFLLDQLQPSSASDALTKARPAHRLDLGTGGLLVLAKRHSALQRLGDAFAEAQVRKTYRALVWGDFPLGSRGESEEPLYGKPCLTRFEAVEEPVETPEGIVSTLDLWPQTGRRHQLRRHLSALGCPILGDRRYGRRLADAAETQAPETPGEEDEDLPEGAMPLFLWALQISLPHPSGDEERRVQAQVAEPQLFADFRAAKRWVPRERATGEKMSGNRDHSCRRWQVRGGEVYDELALLAPPFPGERQQGDAWLLVTGLDNPRVRAELSVFVPCRFSQAETELGFPEWFRTGEARDLLLGIRREGDPGYDEVWHRRFSQLQMAAIESYLAQSASWRCTPSLKRYRELPKLQRGPVAQAFARQLGEVVASVEKPVLCIERPYLEGFVEGYHETGETSPFVLLVVNGGDAPLTEDLQERILALRGLRGCFANNLHTTRTPEMFHPLPLGLTSEVLLEEVRKRAPPWHLRDRRLLVTPMRLHNRLRKRFLEVLTGSEYASVVRVVSETLPYESFLELVSQHQSALSPPGRGYDCGRTWQTLALGTVPLVVCEPTFDQRLHADGPRFIPGCEELSPEALAELLAQLSDPAEHVEKLKTRGDLAWSVLGPGLCSDRDATWGSHVFTDERMNALLGDVTDELQRLESDPKLERWLQAHARSQSQLVGHYYESLLHFAFAELGQITVATYSEPIPKERPSEQGEGKAQVRRFRPPLKSSAGVDFFCNVRRATFAPGGQLQVDFQLKRGRSQDDPPPPECVLHVDGEARRMASHAMSVGNAMDGHAIFNDVTAGCTMNFTYAPSFSQVSLELPKYKGPVQGEVDYVLWSDRGTARFLHIEAAVKFYLAAKDDVQEWDDFIAPNPVDILGKKLRRMLSHQLPMGQTEHIRNLLAGLSKSAAPQISSSLWMNGRLFFHARGSLAALAELPSLAPGWHERIQMLSPDLEVGWWCFLRELEAVLPERLFYLVLRKPYWLAPLRGSGARHVDHGALRSRGQLLRDAKSWRGFQYVVVLSYPDGGPQYEELCRGFVVPDAWPRQRSRSRSPSASETSR
ncbi:unnamed protein product [Effrenium voratum]|nr:unnamed protein product [Effrenium voratum]